MSFTAPILRVACIPGWSVFQNRAWNVSYPQCEKFKMFRTLNVASWKCFMPPFPGKSVKCFVPPTWAKKKRQNVSYPLLKPRIGQNVSYPVFRSRKRHYVSYPLFGPRKRHYASYPLLRSEKHQFLSFPHEGLGDCKLLHKLHWDDSTNKRK